MTADIRYVMILRRDATRCELLNGSEADLYSIIQWGTELKARGKIVAGALVDTNREASMPDGFLILSVESAAEAGDIARSWPVPEGVRVELIRVAGNF